MDHRHRAWPQPRRARPRTARLGRVGHSSEHLSRRQVRTDSEAPRRHRRHRYLGTKGQVMANQLVALLGGSEVGRVRNDNRGRLSLVYTSDWRDTPDTYPVSLSMPLAAQEHGPAVVEAFLWGLLPDNEIVLQRWAKKFQVSPRNAFALIGHVGGDCAGAIQFVLPERLEAAQKRRQAEVEWLTEQDIA